MPQYRLTLDVPYSFAIEPGFQGGKHRHNFSPLSDSFSETWQCPVTKTVMLKPTILRENYFQDIIPYLQMRSTGEPGFWREITRSRDNATFLQSLKPSSKGFTLIALLLDIAILAILAAVDLYRWVLETQAALEVDESFCFYYRALHDERLGRAVLFFLQWDNIGIYFNATGAVEVYQYDRSDMMAEPVKTFEFQAFDPGEVHHRDLFFWFLPIPGLGLVLYTNVVAQNLSFVQASAGAGVSRGTLIPWEARDIEGTLRLFDASPLRVGFRVNIQHQIGVQKVRFAASGTYTDAPFDPGYKPTPGPDLVQGLTFTGGRGAVSASVRKTDNSGAWVAGTDRKGRVQAALTSSDSRYTPFLLGYNVVWQPVFATRDTTPWEVERIFELEYTEDEWKRFEGKASVLIREADGQAIAQRGDATFLLERSLNGGADWETVFGGLTKVPELELIADGFGTYYRGEFQLNDLYERLRETHQLFEASLDNQSLPNAINNTLGGSGLQTIPADDFPAELNDITLPSVPGDSTWRFAPRQGDDGEVILGKLLFLAFRQNVEYRLWWDWDAADWVIERKPRDLETVWSLATRSDRKDAGANRWYYQEATWRPEGPEGNLFLVEAVNATDSRGKRNLGRAETPGSVDDPGSPDYLGRVVIVKVAAEGIGTLEEANLMALRIQRAAGHRRDPLTLTIPRFQDSLAVLTQVVVERDDETDLVSGWIKRRTIRLDRDEREWMTIEVDSVWEGEVHLA